MLICLNPFNIRSEILRQILIFLTSLIAFIFKQSTFSANQQSTDQIFTEQPNIDHTSHHVTEELVCLNLVKNF